MTCSKPATLVYGEARRKLCQDCTDFLPIPAVTEPLRGGGEPCEGMPREPEVVIRLSPGVISELSARKRANLWSSLVQAMGMKVQVAEFNRALGSVFFPSEEPEPPASREVEGKIIPACCQKAKAGYVWWEMSPSGNSTQGWVMTSGVTMERRELSRTTTLTGAMVTVSYVNVRNCPFCGELLRCPSL